MSSTTCICKASENVYEKDELTSQKLSLLQWVVHKNCFSDLCNGERTAMIVPWHDERTRTGAFVILPADELLSANINKKRSQCELPMTTDFDAPLRTQTIITDKVYTCRGMSIDRRRPAAGARLASRSAAGPLLVFVTGACGSLVPSKMRKARRLSSNRREK